MVHLITGIQESFMTIINLSELTIRMTRCTASLQCVLIDAQLLKKEEFRMYADEAVTLLLMSSGTLVPPTLI